MRNLHAFLIRFGGLYVEHMPYSISKNKIESSIFNCTRASRTQVKADKKSVESSLIKDYFMKSLAPTPLSTNE